MDVAVGGNRPLDVTRSRPPLTMQVRDKVATSKRKGIWMGGAVPLAYLVEDRALHVVEDEAEFVRSRGGPGRSGCRAQMSNRLATSNRSRNGGEADGQAAPRRHPDAVRLAGDWPGRRDQSGAFGARSEARRQNRQDHGAHFRRASSQIGLEHVPRPKSRRNGSLSQSAAPIRAAGSFQSLALQEKTGFPFERERVCVWWPSAKAVASRANPSPRRSLRSGARVSEGPGSAGSRNARVQTCRSNSTTRSLCC